jgi:hypothetical protein
MTTTQLGSQSFANLIRGHSDLDFSSQKDEEEDNSRDAGATFTFTCLLDSYGDDAPHKTSYMQLDNGKGMPPMKLLSASTGNMKNGADIGQYYRGGLSNLMSKRATTTFQFSREEGQPLMLVKYKFCKMFKNVDEGFSDGKNGEAITNDIFTGLTKRTVYGPYILGDEDSNITNEMFDDSLNLFRQSEPCAAAIEKFINDPLQTGTAFVYHWDNDDLCKFNDLNIERYYKALPYKRKNQIDVKYWHNGELYIPETTGMNFFGNPQTSEVVVINCYYATNAGRCIVLMKYNNQVFRCVQGENNGKITIQNGEKVTVENWDSHSIENGTGHFVPFDIKFTLVSSNIANQQLNDLGISDHKILNRPVLETPYGFLGIGGMLFPEAWTSRSAFGLLESINFRSAVSIPQVSKETLFQLFGVNGHKDSPDCRSGATFPTVVFHDIILSIMKMWAKKWGEFFIRARVDEANATRCIKEEIDEYGYTAETVEWFPAEDISACALLGEKYSKKNTRHYRRWYKDVITPFVEPVAVPVTAPAPVPDIAPVPVIAPVPAATTNAQAAVSLQFTEDGALGADMVWLEDTNEAFCDLAQQSASQEATTSAFAPVIAPITAPVLVAESAVVMAAPKIPVSSSHVPAHNRLTRPRMSQREQFNYMMQLMSEVNDSMLEKLDNVETQDDEFVNVYNRLHQQIHDLQDE